MTSTLQNIVSAKLVNISTKEELPLEQKKDSYCHFVPDNKREIFGKYEIRFRLDWKDLNDEHDPSLDADLFDQNGKQINKKETLMILGEAHHTKKRLDAQQNLYLYQFDKIGVSFEFITKFIMQATQTGTARIQK